jgi:predicted HAD superfamily Cof-like phosphohydrolase
MKNLLKDVENFQRDVTGIEPADSPTLVDGEYCVARANFMSEEVDEFLEAALGGNLVGVADALGDVIYVAVGTALTMGIPLDKVWDLIQAANMRKVKGMTKRGIANDAVKPPGWVGPEAGIAALLARAVDGDATFT